MIVFTTTDLDHTGADAALSKVTSVRGFHVEAGAAAAVVLLRNGGSSGAILVPIKVAANTSTHFSSPQPILFQKGLYIDTDSNVAHGSVQPG